MRSMFTVGFHKAQLGHAFGVGFHKARLGQGFDWLTPLINAGVQSYKLYTDEERYQEEQEFEEDQAARTQAREDAALKFQQDLMKNLQEQNTPKPEGAKGATDDTILGMKPVAFYSVAGVSVGALILGVIMMTRGE